MSRSDQFHKSLTVWAANTAGVARFLVASQLTALAPFSQNSKAEVCFGSGQAQPGQSKPSGWLFRRSSFPPETVSICSRSARATARSAPQPPAGPS